MRLFLASSSLAALPKFVAGAGAKRAGLIPTAAERLADRVAMVRRVRAELRDAALDVVLCDPDAPDARALLASCDLIAVSGGDPFHLRARLRATGFDRAIVERVRQGTPYVGVSAGAIIAGPSLEPVTKTSPFAPAPGEPLDGLGLTDCVILPHHDREGRAAKHAEAARAFAGRFSLVPLANREALVVEDGEARVVRGANEEARKTWDGLRADADVPTIALDDVEGFAREADAKAEERDVAKWRALFDAGLVSDESIPILQVARNEVRWSSCDDVEVHVLLRIDGGASLGAMAKEGRYDEEAIRGALSRLIARGVIRFDS